jgi:hypothetical protein
MFWVLARVCLFAAYVSSAAVGAACMLYALWAASMMYAGAGHCFGVRPCPTHDYVSAQKSLHWLMTCHQLADPTNTRSQLLT